jgi:hypothetical protein
MEPLLGGKGKICKSETAGLLQKIAARLGQPV